MGENYNFVMTFSSSNHLSAVTPTTILPFSNQEAKIYVYVASKLLVIIKRNIKVNIFISACHGHCRAKNHYLPLSNLSSLRSHLKKVVEAVQAFQHPEIRFKVAQKCSQGIVVLPDPSAWVCETPSCKLETHNDSMSGIRHLTLKSGLLIEI